MKVVYEWLKEYVGEDMPEVQKFEELLTFHAFEIDGVEEVQGQTVIDVKVLPDRGADCLSHRGIARELATLTGTPLQHDPLSEPVSLTPATDKIQINIEDSENCGRFALALITGVTVKESPEWLKRRLEAVGQRSINNIVDATNYVMLVLGQPLHAYDGARFETKEGVWNFGIRLARENEEVTILGGETLKLTKGVQVIVNGVTDMPVGIAGIKGGKSAEIDASTTTVILEAANFNPQVTRKGSQALRLQTDASKRFENNLSPELVPYALALCAKLIQELAGGSLEGYADMYPKSSKNTPVPVLRTHIHALLGLSLSDSMIEDILSRLGFTYDKQKDGWEVLPPFERKDILIPEDVIAEIGRVHGYEHIASVIPEPRVLHEINARYYYSEKLRASLVEKGLSEVITSSFRKKDTIELLNALASDKGCLRSTLRDSIRGVLDRNMPNADLLGVSSVEVFEIGTVFTKTGDDVVEHVALGIGVRTKQQGHTPKDDERLKHIISGIESGLGFKLPGTIEKGVFECNLSEVVEHLPMPAAYEPFTYTNESVFVPYSQYPFISRDIALWVPQGVEAHDITSMIREDSGDLLVRVALFDEFKKDGRTSYAFRLVFQSSSRTLTDDEINSLMEGLYGEAKKRGFEVR